MQRAETLARPDIRPTTRLQRVPCRLYRPIDESFIRYRTSAIALRVRWPPHFQYAGRRHTFAADEVVKGKVECVWIEA
jgi:hypothetical protein